VDYPKTYETTADLPSVTAVVRDVLPRLIGGDDPASAGLRAQLGCMTVGPVEMTGVGSYADLVVPSDVPGVEPSRLVGGDAEIWLSGAEHGAGCLLFVEGGRLASLEGYTYGGDEWRPDSVVLSVGCVAALEPSILPLQQPKADGARPKLNEPGPRGSSR
jgi:hypothetical protein